MKDEQVKNVVKRFLKTDNEDPIIQILDMIIKMQQKKYPGRPVFKSVSFRSEEKINVKR